MRKLTILSICFLLLTVTITVAERQLDTGKDWNNWDLSHKAHYIAGFRDGIALAISGMGESTQKRNVEANLYLGDAEASFSHGEFVTALNTFYADSSNLRIPIVTAYMYVIKKFKGASKDELDDMLARLRANFR